VWAQERCTFKSVCRVRRVRWGFHSSSGTRAHRQYEDARAAEHAEMKSISSSIHPDSHAVVVGSLGECCDQRKAAVWLHRRFGLVAFYQSACTRGSQGRLRASTY
jgi:hypothetical protein